MKIVMTGSRGSFGGYIREQLEAQGHSVFGVGLHSNEEIVMDFLQLPSGEAVEEFAADLVRDEQPEVFINHAGMTYIEKIDEHPLDKFMDVLALNCGIPFAFCKAVISQSLADTKRRRILNVGSMASKMGLRCCPAYPASKAALEAMTRSLAKECGSNVPVSLFALGPGGIEDSGMIDYAIERLQSVRGMSEAQARHYNQQGGLGRYCTHDEIWKMYDFIINSAPDFATGSVWHMSNATGL